MDEEIKSKEFEFNKGDFVRLLRAVVIFYWPLIIIFLDRIEVMITSWEIDYRLAWALFISMLFEWIRRYLKLSI